MILTRLVLTNFGAFHGVQTFDLAPRSNRPIILVGGKNGAGKTTILEAIRLCFYGQSGGGARSKEDYLTYLDGRIHIDPTALIQTTFASVAVHFQYGDVDGLHEYSITRAWERRPSSRIHENLTIEKDGQPMTDLAPDDWQDFVRDLIPVGVSQLFFFDGEKIQHLADDESDQRTLAESIKSLLGLDIIERLETDLDVYLARSRKSQRPTSSHKELQELEEVIDKLRVDSEMKQASLKEHEATATQAKKLIESLEGEIASRGGAFARQRESLLGQESALRTSIGVYEQRLRDLCAGLLPFVLATRLCAAVKSRIVSEEENTLRSGGEKYVQRLESFLGRRLRPPVRKTVAELIKEFRQTEFRDDKTDEVLNVSVDQKRQILGWGEQITTSLPREITEIRSRLESDQADLRRCHEKLRKATPDEELRPVMELLHNAHKQLANATAAASVLIEDLRSLELKILDGERAVKQANEKLSLEIAAQNKRRVVPEIKAVLDEYKRALLAKKVEELQDVVTDCFSRLCRKKDTLRLIRVDKSTFAITLEDGRGTKLMKSQLSAGEKQIYAVSMLWGLARTSGRPLPMVIDTPLARLDRDHRTLLALNYFPNASHQTIILSTDTEVDQAYFEELRPAVARCLHLQFDELVGGTTVESGYFWNKKTHETNENQTIHGSVQSAALSRG